MSAPNKVARPVRVRFFQRRIWYICPKCGQPIEFLKKCHGTSLCMKCGQRLDWSPVSDIHMTTFIAEDSGMAAWIAENYFREAKIQEKDWFDLEKWRLSLSGKKDIPLYLVFEDSKGYGRFMRIVAKEGLKPAKFPA